MGTSHLRLGYPLGRDLGPVTGVPIKKDMGPVEVLWHGDRIPPGKDMGPGKYYEMEMEYPQC